MKKWVASPLISIALVFALGILIAESINIPFFFVYFLGSLFLISAIATLERNYLFSCFFLIFVFIFGLLFCSNFKQLPSDHIKNFTSPGEKIVYLTGVVRTDVSSAITSYKQKKISFILEAEGLKENSIWRGVSGKIQVFIYGQSKTITYGDRLLLEGRLVFPSLAGNPGQFDYRSFLKRKGIYTLLTVGAKNVIEILEDNQGNSVIGFALKFKRRMESIIASNLPSPHKELLAAMMLGNREQLPDRWKEIFIKTGTFHILAISGLHVGLVLSIFAFGFKIIHFPRKASFVLIILLLFIYALITGARPSVLRATIMAAVFLVGLLLERDVDIYNSIALAGLIILFIHPLQLFDAGFQLSFIAVISIIYLTPRIERLFHNKKVKYFLVKSFSVSTSAWLGVAPLIAYYFNIVTPITILANLIVIPLMFIIIVTGFCLVSLGPIAEILAFALGKASWLSLVVLTQVVSLLRHRIGYFYVGAPSLFIIVGYYLFLCLCVNYKRLGISKGKIIIILLLISNLFIFHSVLASPAPKLTVTFLDMGDGDAIFIEFPYSGTMLIDGGRAGEENSRKNILATYLRNKGLSKIDAVLLTHSHSDHLGGVVSVLNNFRVSYLFDNGMESLSREWEDYRKVVNKRKIPYRRIRAGEKIVGYPKTNIYVLHPPQRLLASRDAEINNNSVVLKIEYGNIAFILSADIEAEAIEELSKYGKNLKSTIIKIPHHGGDMGEGGRSFLEFVNPEVAIISTSGRAKSLLSYSRLLANLESFGTQLYSTDEYGAISVSTDGRTYSISGYKK